MNDPTPFARMFGIAAIAVMAVTGCATVHVPTPTDQLAVANAAVADAAGTDAAQLSASEFTAAQRKLARAQQALGAGDNAAARELAEEAEVDARLAATHARAAKAVRAAAEVQASNQALRDEIAQRP
jgi:uncharacterized protein DUF4398